ncbi:hypothetical protein JR316_0010385 [Psilocybe cubensis]|uniref:Uncharacterized protein n=2 Tax=Psilocybe cubensis TaxID=181762 RepID=A0A8H8CDV7_PSICU|nr:hypothetical protein JR316_0010385 [Psilocybe cubensis]KAH9476473.1 hypothetical protein JR316_0010385 [Psilocybe cubensis]
MSISDMPTPAIEEDYIISGNLNGPMLYNSLMGVYTVVYGSTIYVYMSRAASNTRRCIVLTTISVLYLLALCNLILNWYFLDQSLVKDGDTRDTTFASMLSTPLWFNAMFAFLQNMSIVISDGLLIWRCYYVWGRCIKVTSILCLLLVTEFILSVTDTVFYGLSSTYSSISNAALSENILIALTFISMGTTVSTTTLIGYKIHTTSFPSTSPLPFKSARKPIYTRYARIVSTIAESSAVYSLVVVLYAVTVVVPAFYSITSVFTEVSYYIQAVLLIIPGLATTIMVLRLALNSTSSADASDTITHISEINFDHSEQDTIGYSDYNSSGASSSNRCTSNILDPITFSQSACTGSFDRHAHSFDVARQDEDAHDSEVASQSWL